MNADDQNEKTLRLLLRAEFAEFKVGFFQELQVKLDTKADRLPFELLAKDVADLKASDKARLHLEPDFAEVVKRVDVLERSRAAETARQSGVWLVLRQVKVVGGWVVAGVLAATDLYLRLRHH